jgi:Rrf2 family nitric oxide-sensitive transcriptional repressor
MYLIYIFYGNGTCPRPATIMRLTTFTDYALRVLMQVGMHDGDLVRIDDIADRFGISRNHLTKVVHNLGRYGYLETVRGRHGGMRLARRPELIVVGDVVRKFEQQIALVPCFDPAADRCRISGPCRLTGLLGDAREAFFDHLDQATLADLLAPRRQLGQALGIELAPRRAAPSPAS